MSTHRNIIDKNLVVLCELTNCNDILVDRCTERDVLTRAEKDEIEIEKIMFKRNRTFYEIIRRKDESTFQVVVEIMKEESTAQSSDILKILEGNQSGPSSQKCTILLKNRVEVDEESVWFNVHDPITSFVGRENELRELHEIVTRNAEEDTQVAVMSQLSSVSGMGGIGKTTLAREYAKRYASFFNNNVIWINAETTTSTEESFRELANEICVRNKNPEKENAKVFQISKVTKDTYEYFSSRKCLFVFDNVEEYKSTVAPFIPKSYQPGKIRPYILMTSRKQRLVDDCRVLTLDVLVMEDAEKFIKSKLQKCMGKIDNVSVRKLADELQCLPLALQQAVSYIQNQVRLKSIFSRKKRNHIEEYLRLLEENPKVPLNHEYQEETMDDYAFTVMRTWDVTLKAIEREEYGIQAIEILEMLPYFPPERIDVGKFDYAFSEQELRHSCVILEQYSLISRVGEYINIHRLVQKVIRVLNKEKDREEYILRRCLYLVVRDANWNYLVQNKMNWNIWKHSVGYENLVIKYGYILGKIFIFTNLKDLEILNSSLEILEKNTPQCELVDLYFTFIDFVLDEVEIHSGDVPDLLHQKVMTRLNALLELGHSIQKIIDSISSWFQLHTVTLIPKLVRDVMEVIRRHCYNHSAETFPRHYSFESTCLQMALWFEVRKTVRGERERELVRKVINLRRYQAEVQSLEKVYLFLSSILGLLLIDSNSVNEIQSCVHEVFIQMRNELTTFQDIVPKIRLWWLVQLHFGRTVNDIIYVY